MSALLFGLLSAAAQNQACKTEEAERQRVGRLLHRFLLCDGLLMDFDDPKIGLVCVPNINSRSDELVPSYQCFGRVHPEPDREMRDMLERPWQQNMPHLEGPSGLLAVAAWAREAGFSGAVHSALWAPQATLRLPRKNWPLPRVVWSNPIGHRMVHGEILGFLDSHNAGPCRMGFVIDCENIAQIRQVVDRWPAQMAA